MDPRAGLLAHAAVVTLNEQVSNLFTQSSGTGPLLADVASRVFNPLAHLRTSGATLLLSAFLLLAYLTMVALMNVERDERCRRTAGCRAGTAR